MTIQNIFVERNQLWKHKKGTTYKIYGIAEQRFCNLGFKHVLYYQVYDNNDEEAFYLPHFVFDIETLEKVNLCVKNVYDPLNSLFLDYKHPYELTSKEAIEQLKKSKIHFLWARELSNFLNIDQNDVKRFVLLNR